MSDSSISSAASSHTVADLVRDITVQFRGAAIEHAAAEARDIVAIVSDMPRLWPVLNGGVILSEQQSTAAQRAAQKRVNGAPFAYAVGQAAFRHLTLRVDERVLIPRQETEQLVQLVLDRTMAHSPKATSGVALDVGTGSGAIALSLATEAGKDASFDRIIASDISRDAIDVAAENARTILNADSLAVEFRVGDMFSNIRETDLCAVVSNPPYVAFEEARSLPPSVRDWEPAMALYGAGQGMRTIARLVQGAARALRSGGLLAFEVDSTRASLAAELVLTSGAFRNVSVELDLTGRERFVLATKE